MSAAPDARLASLDAFRGFAIASMVLVNNPGDWAHLHAPLAHAEWNGWTFTDTVFPFFLFAAGMSIAVSLDRRLRAGDDRARLLAAIARRALVIFLVGLALNFFPAFDLATVRILGVLQRIALCIVIAAPVALYGGARIIAFAIVALLALYSILMLAVPVPGPEGVVASGLLEPGRDFGAWVDRHVLGAHLWSHSRTWDPEGLVSTLPAACSLLLGLATGRWLIRSGATAATSARLVMAALAALAAGLVLDRLLMPINKNLWTPSYAIFMTGTALLAFAFFHFTMDVHAHGRRLFMPLVIYGMNALFIFAFSGFVARLLILGDTKRALYDPIQALPLSAENASLVYAVAFDLAMFAVAWFMWRRRWFVRA